MNGWEEMMGLVHSLSIGADGAQFSSKATTLSVRCLDDHTQPTTPGPVGAVAVWEVGSLRCGAWSFAPRGRAGGRRDRGRLG
jgi:hypothetical protein